ncbi:MAG: family protein-serine/threonine phosphatase [Acidobacteriota bacterium]|nr:family protein-serine/threonine phosphatase [Acidobacteriota bacterium]
MTDTRYADIRQLMKRVEQLVREIQSADEVGITIYNLADAIIARFRDALGFYGGRLYQWDGEAYELKATFPNAKPAEREIRVPATYAPIEIALSEGVVYMGPDDPRFDHKFEDQLGVDRFAAIEVGDEEFILSFDLAPSSHRDDVLFSLGVLRHAINQKLRQERMQEVFDEARKIQMSILPRRTPVYGGFELYGRIQPMESVGGDFYDYIPITDKILGLAIADVSGHGLPAALQVRDIYMGLRMGMARDFKIVRTVERLNQIIHKSTLTSRFVSMFYGELEPNGVFIYVNAGHPAPFHLSATGDVRNLDEGGPVLGPLAEATYERGFIRLNPGDMVVLYTDGMIEATPAGSDSGEEFGIERLVEIARRLRGKSSKEIAETMMKAVESYRGEGEAQDDRTVVVVTYPPAPAGN